MASRITTNAAKRRRLRDANPADTLLDALIRSHALILREGEAIGVEAVRTVLQASELPAMDAIRRIALDSGGMPRTRRAAQVFYRQLREIRAEAIRSAVTITERAAGNAAAERSAQIARSSLQVSALSSGDVAPFLALSSQQVEQVATRRYFGATTRGWFAGIESRGAARIQKELRQAFLFGESVDQAASRVRRVFKIDRHEATTIARTAIQAASNEAATDLYALNARHLDGIQWVATLDSRTCALCGPYDGRVYGMTEARPEIPAHPNCRCMWAPVPKGLPVPKVQAWGQWIQRQPHDFQDRVLGPTRARLLRSGEVAPKSFITDGGRLRSVREVQNQARGAA